MLQKESLLPCSVSHPHRPHPWHFLFILSEIISSCTYILKMHNIISLYIKKVYIFAFHKLIIYLGDLSVLILYSFLNYTLVYNCICIYINILKVYVLFIYFLFSVFGKNYRDAEAQPWNWTLEKVSVGQQEMMEWGIFYYTSPFLFWRVGAESTQQIGVCWLFEVKVCFSLYPSLKHQRQTEISMSKSCFLYLESILRICGLHPGLRPVTSHLVVKTTSSTGFPSSTWFATVCSYHCSPHHPFKWKPEQASPSLRTPQLLILFRMKPKAS